MTLLRHLFPLFLVVRIASGALPHADVVVAVTPAFCDLSAQAGVVADTMRSGRLGVAAAGIEADALAIRGVGVGLVLAIGSDVPVSVNLYPVSGLADDGVVRCRGVTVAVDLVPEAPAVCAVATLAAPLDAAVLRAPGMEIREPTGLNGGHVAVLCAESGVVAENVMPAAELTGVAGAGLRVVPVLGLVADLTALSPDALGENGIAKERDVDSHVMVVGVVEDKACAIERRGVVLAPELAACLSVGSEADLLAAIPFGIDVAALRDVPMSLRIGDSGSAIDKAIAAIRCMADGGKMLSPNAPVIVGQGRARAVEAEWSLLPMSTWWYGPLGMLRRQADAAAQGGDEARARELRTEFWEVFRAATERREGFRKIEEQRKNWRRGGRGQR